MAHFLHEVQYYKPQTDGKRGDETLVNLNLFLLPIKPGCCVRCCHGNLSRFLYFFRRTKNKQTPCKTGSVFKRLSGSDVGIDNILSPACRRPHSHGVVPSRPITASPLTAGGGGADSPSWTEELLSCSSDVRAGPLS